MTAAPEPTAQEVLALPLAKDNDAGAATAGDYLISLLATLWREQDGFTAKHPFGGDDWAYDLYTPMARAGWIHGTFDADGWVEDMDTQAGDDLVMKAIGALGDGTEPSFCCLRARYDGILAVVRTLGDALPADARAEIAGILR